MSERKYRQRGYMDDDRDRQSRPSRPSQPPERAPRGQPPLAPRTPNLMGYREIVRCAQCGHPVSRDIAPDARCDRCGNDLHACTQCVAFDPGARFECTKPVPVRVSPKNRRNECTLFEARVTLEKQTGSAGPTDARKAFDDLFR